jgi:peptidoglycan endopeptidase LytE
VPAVAPPLARDIVNTALTLVGTPYRNGGSDPSGFDCSGFVQYVFSRYGISLPRSVVTQSLAGREVEPASIRAGDLVFFWTSGRKASHVGIALGDGRFVHAPSSRGAVRVESLAGAYWDPRLAGARRVIEP